uniref:PREDICTED: similar to retrotransposon protein putati n=1 Tax=Albugo laibachii Nc14 TaxID=890382 RepID=F0W6X4_9STRA|nr:PREDICTED: similar to retrotransposon protein putati [Albugo laibachii Nc14]|eukprot:CCA16869.1 PREDICTED: similar to retrotransposon protein putati [Albugo laibachii Nc14]
MGETPTTMLESYSDADYAADCADRKSVTGGVICLNGTIVGWMCQKQASVPLSTMEAEFVAASLMASDLLGLEEILGEIGVCVVKPMMMHVYNQAAIKQIQGEDSSVRAKYIVVRLKYTKDYSQKEVTQVEYCESRLMRADILTKTFAAPRFIGLRKLISLV